MQYTIVTGMSGSGKTKVIRYLEDMGYFSKKMLNNEFSKILLIATGALMSPSSVLLGEPISGIAHAVSIERV